MKNTVLYITTLCLLTICLVTGKIAGQQKIVQQVHQILVYGLPPEPLYQNAEKVIGKQWNIELVAAGGCVVSEEMQDSINRFNAQSDLALTAIHGQDWKLRFYKEIEQEYKREQHIASILDADENLSKAMSENEDAFFTYEMFPVHGTSLYDVKVNNIETWEDRTSSVTYFRIRVDPDKKSIKINSRAKEFNFAYE